MAIDKVLDEFNLKRENLVGLGVHGYSTMLGERRGLATRVKETSPSLISFHCPAHRIQLAIRDISKDVCPI